MEPDRHLQEPALSNRIDRTQCCHFAPALLVDGVFLDHFGALFDCHVVKFFRIKDFATLQAFDKLGVLEPGDDAYSWVFAGRCHRDRKFGIEIGCSFRRL